MFQLVVALNLCPPIAVKKLRSCFHDFFFFLRNNILVTCYYNILVLPKFFLLNTPGFLHFGSFPNIMSGNFIAGKLFVAQFRILSLLLRI